MEKIEIILDNYPQETKNAALVAALKSGDSTLIDFALKLKPDILAGGEELFKYAITNCNFELLGKLLSQPEICDNQELMNEGVRVAVSLTRVEWYEVLAELIAEGASMDVAITALLELDYPSVEVITGLLDLGAKAYFYPMHLEKHQLIAETLIKKGFGKSVEFSRVALEQFCYTICKSDKQGVVKKLIKDRPEWIGILTEIAVKEGCSRIIKLLHQENAITTIDDKLFEKAICGKHYLVVKYLVENGIRELKFTDVINAAAFGGIKMMFFLIEQIKKQGKTPTLDKFASVIEVACVYDRKDSVVALLEAGYECDFDANIKQAASHGYMKMVDILMKYANTLSYTSFDEAMRMAWLNNHIHTSNRMRAYREKNPQKFQ